MKLNDQDVDRPLNTLQSHQNVMLRSLNGRLYGCGRHLPRSRRAALLPYSVATERAQQPALSQTLYEDT